MNFRRFLFLIAGFHALVSGLIAAVPKTTIEPRDASLTIAFGSCNHELGKQPLWKPILEEKPDIWVWLGDNVYGDTEDMEIMRSKYDRNKQQPDYQKLRENTRIHGTWDDHDYGVNDGGKEYPKKAESKAEFIRFIEFPKDHPIHSREGIFHAQDYQTPDGFRLRLILLDTRSFRDPIYKKKDPRTERKYYEPNENGTLLGKEQWNWLEPLLDGNAFDLVVIGSSIQFLAQGHPYEKWGNFPNERAKLLGWIEAQCPGKAIILSGDRHHSEISKMPLNTGDHLIDVTSSGLNRHGGLPPEPNPYRVGPFNGKINYGVLHIHPETAKAEIFIKGEGGSVISQLEYSL